MGDLVYLASTPTEFSRQVGHALAENDPSRRIRRREIALLESWDARARDISDTFQWLGQAAQKPVRFPLEPQTD